MTSVDIDAELKSLAQPKETKSKSKPIAVNRPPPQY